METVSPRNFNCKNEELPVIAGFSAISLERDLADFGAYSPVFNTAYLDAYKAKIVVVDDLVQPKSETLELKMLNERIYATLDSLISPINYVEGYLNLAGKTVPVSATDFGLTPLRKSARSRDVESVLKLLRTVEGNLKKYKTELEAKGLTEALVLKFAEAGTALASDRNKKYELVSNRMALVQNNLGLLNDLYDQLVEICKIGKILYKQTDKAKLNDYTFSFLLKQVRRVEKPEEPKTEVQPVPETE
jgi:hypothetical protein